MTIDTFKAKGEPSTPSAQGNSGAIASEETSSVSGGGDGFDAWLDRDWPLWRNNPDSPNVARLRRCWEATLSTPQARPDGGLSRSLKLAVAEEQAEAWQAVCGLLTELRPGWAVGGGERKTGLENALDTIRALAHATPAPDGGEAVAEVADLCGLRVPSWIGAGASPSLPVGTKLYTHPTPAPDAVARLVELAREVAAGKVANDPEVYALLAEEALADWTAAQQEGE